MPFVAGGAKPLPYISLLVLLLSAATAGAQDRTIPFWPNSVPAAIHSEVDGVAALETVRELGRYHRVQGSPGFAAAAEMMKRKGDRRRALRRRDRALPRRRKDEVRALSLARGLGPGVRHARGNHADQAPDRRIPRPSRRACGLLAGRRRHGRARGRRQGHVGEGLRGQGCPRQDRPRRRNAPDGPPARLRRAGRRGIPLRLPEPGDALVRRRPRHGSLGAPVALPAPEPVRVHGLEAPGRGLPRAPGDGREGHPARGREGEDGPGDLRRRRGHDPGNRSRVRRSRHDRAHLPRVRRRQRQRIRQRRDPRSRADAGRRDPEKDAPTAAAHDPLSLAARDHGLAGLPCAASRNRGAAQGRRAHGHGGRDPVDHEGDVPSLAHGREPAARGQRRGGRVVRRGRRGLGPLRRRARRRVRGIRLASGLARDVPRRRARPQHGQRPRGLRGRGLPRADGLLPRLPRRHDPHPEGPAREPRRDQARARRLHGRRV